MKALIFIIATLVSFNLKASDSHIKIQYGVGANPEDIIDDTKRTVLIGYFDNLEKSLAWGVSAGWLGDRRVGLNTGYMCAQFGAEIQILSFAYVNNFFGPCYFGLGDEPFGNITGRLQAATNLGIGWRDKDSKSQVGLNILHFSNGGIARPNKGIDLISINLSFGL